MDSNKLTILLMLAAMILLIVGVDVLFFRQHFLARFVVNLGIVLVFFGIYLRFFK